MITYEMVCEHNKNITTGDGNTITVKIGDGHISLKYGIRFRVSKNPDVQALNIFKALIKVRKKLEEVTKYKYCEDCGKLEDL